LDYSCSWLLQFNTGASTNDTLTVRVNRLRSAKLLYMVANSYSDSGTNFTVANTNYPQKVYLTVLGSDGFNYVDLNI
jgi:hypothetical protein